MAAVAGNSGFLDLVWFPDHLYFGRWDISTFNRNIDSRTESDSQMGKREKLKPKNITDLDGPTANADDIQAMSVSLLFPDRVLPR
jgi:hypothetical protein